MPQESSFARLSSFASIAEQKLDTPILIISPSHPSRLALVANLLSQQDSLIHYYALTAEVTSIKRLLENLLNDPQFPSFFGHYTQGAIQSSQDTQILAQAFAHDLASLHKAEYLLMLDQLDYLQSQDTQAYRTFFLSLAEQLSPHPSR